MSKNVVMLTGNDIDTEYLKTIDGFYEPCLEIFGRLDKTFRGFSAWYEEGEENPYAYRLIFTDSQGNELNWQVGPVCVNARTFEVFGGVEGSFDVVSSTLYNSAVDLVAILAKRLEEGSLEK